MESIEGIFLIKNLSLSTRIRNQIRSVLDSPSAAGCDIGAGGVGVGCLGTDLRFGDSGGRVANIGKQDKHR